MLHVILSRLAILAGRSNHQILLRADRLAPWFGKPAAVHYESNEDEKKFGFFLPLLVLKRLPRLELDKYHKCHVHDS